MKAKKNIILNEKGEDLMLVMDKLRQISNDSEEKYANSKKEFRDAVELASHQDEISELCTKLTLWYRAVHVDQMEKVITVAALKRSMKPIYEFLQRNSRIGGHNNSMRRMYKELRTLFQKKF